MEKICSDHEGVSDAEAIERIAEFGITPPNDLADRLKMAFHFIYSLFISFLALRLLVILLLVVSWKAQIHALDSSFLPFRAVYILTLIVAPFLYCRFMRERQIQGYRDDIETARDSARKHFESLRMNYHAFPGAVNSFKEDVEAKAYQEAFEDYEDCLQAHPSFTRYIVLKYRGKINQDDQRVIERYEKIIALAERTPECVRVWGRLKHLRKMEYAAREAAEIAGEEQAAEGVFAMNEDGGERIPHFLT